MPTIDFDVQTSSASLPCTLLTTEADAATLSSFSPSRHGRAPTWSTAPLLLTLGMSRASALGEAPHDIPARQFVAAGGRALSFDLPNHGDRLDAFGSGIEGFAAACVAGDDPFVRFVADAQAVLTACVESGLASSDQIVACGVSRAAYCALRLAAADRRVAAVAGLAPVTDWRGLREFAYCAERLEVAALAIDRWAADLAGRPIFLAIGNADGRVGTQHCARLALRLYEEESARQLVASSVECHLVPSEGHALSADWRAAGGRFLLQTIGLLPHVFGKE